MRIGIFDSGIGGVSVLHEAVSLLPEEEYIFYADVDHVPYGVKTSEQVKEYVDEIVSQLISMEVDAVVIACNTATSVAANHVRAKYDIPILGMEPAVKPAVEAASESVSENSRVLVMATPITIRENKLHTLLEKVDTQHRVDLLSMPGFVRMAESEQFDGEEVDGYIEEQMAVLNKDLYTEVVLGCTHFNYFKPALKKFFGESVELIDGNLGTVRHMAKVLGLELQETDNTAKNKNFDYENVHYFESGRLVTEQEKLDKFRRLHARLEEVHDIR